ncbi:hypothetical protein GUJ93_ZPchr0005g15637 [Zizania palustris]|uniref:FLZ-type domain-containing protein n=1 Tax=Zizania palustris TaxID=103762 RepID=A0A8J5T5P8_ZIZPA|nr:hypothetical protein GUJ93_ZPchr0005g15637 [Zizania palustris]
MSEPRGSLLSHPSQPAAPQPRRPGRSITAVARRQCAAQPLPLPSPRHAAPAIVRPRSHSPRAGAPPCRRRAAQTAAFLRACGLCNRRLGPGRDTYMYKYVEKKKSGHTSSLISFVHLIVCTETEIEIRFRSMAAKVSTNLLACGVFVCSGDTAFCSLECRQQHITHEKWKEKLLA